MSLTSNGALCGNRHIACRWLIGADGGQSRVRRWAGINTHESSVRYGFRRHYQVTPWSDYVEVYWAPGFQVYVAGVARDEVCLALLVCPDTETKSPSAARNPTFAAAQNEALSWVRRASQIRIDDALDYFPELAERLDNAGHISQERGGISAMRRVAAVTQGRIALIGDASGSVDAITGQGICLAFEQALALAEALAGDELESYETAHRAIMRRPRTMAQLLLLLDRHPGLRATALQRMAENPRIFEWLLAYHVGAVSKTVGSVRAAIAAQIGLGNKRKRLAAGSQAR